MTPHKPLGQTLPSLKFMWPLGAQPLNILDTLIQQKRQQSPSQDSPCSFARSPFFSENYARRIQRKSNVSNINLSSSKTQLRSEDTSPDISPQILPQINELEYPGYSEIENNNLSDEKPYFDGENILAETPEFPVETVLSESSQLNEMDTSQQSIELTNSIATLRISPQGQADSINLSKISANSNIFPGNEKSSENHDVSTKLDVGEGLGFQGDSIDLPIDSTVTFASPIDLNLKPDQNPPSVSLDSPSIALAPKSSTQKSTVSNNPTSLISSSSMQVEPISDRYQKIENSAQNDLASTSESTEIDVVLDSPYTIYRQPEIVDAIDIVNTSGISTNSIDSIAVPSQLLLTSASADSQAELKPEKIADVQLSAVTSSSLAEQDSVNNESISGENNSPDLISPVDSDSSVINASSSNRLSSGSISQETISIARHKSDIGISDLQTLTSPISGEISAVIAELPIASPYSLQIDRTYLSHQTNSKDTENIVVSQLSDNNNDTIIPESSLDSNIISPQFESDIEASTDNIINSHSSLNTENSRLSERSQTNGLNSLSQALNSRSNSEYGMSEAQLSTGNLNNNISPIFFEINQGIELNDTRDLIDGSSENRSSITSLVAPDRAVNQSNQPPSAPETIDISTEQSTPSGNQSFADEASSPLTNSIQLSSNTEIFDSFGPVSDELNTTDVDLPVQDQPQQLSTAETDFGVSGQDLDASSLMIDIQPSSLSIATSPEKLLEPLSESSETGFIAPSIDTSESSTDSDINQTVIDLPSATDHFGSTDSQLSLIQDENIAELNGDVNNITETGLVNNPSQRRLEPTVESISIDLSLANSMNRRSNLSLPINPEPINIEGDDLTNQLPEINHETSVPVDVFKTETQQFDDLELSSVTTSIVDNSDSLSISAAKPQILQKLSILDPQLTQPRRPSQNTNAALTFTLSPLISPPAPSSKIQRTSLNATERMGIISGAYSPVLQRFSSEDDSADRFDDQPNSSDVTSSWGNISDLLNSTDIDENQDSFTPASYPGQLIIQPKSIGQSTPIWNEDRQTTDPLDAGRSFTNLHPYESLPQVIPSVQEAESISPNPTSYIAKLNSESQLVSDQNSIMDTSAQTHSATNTDAKQKDNSANLEQLAQITYRLIQQKIAIERERAGGYYSGRLPW